MYNSLQKYFLQSGNSDSYRLYLELTLPVLYRSEELREVGAGGGRQVVREAVDGLLLEGGVGHV